MTALAARAAVGPAARMSATALSTAASSAWNALDDLVHQADAERTRRVEAAPAGEQRPGVGFADLGDHERGDHRRKDPETRLGEPELGACFGDHDVAHGTQPHAAAQRRALDARDHGDRARVDRVEHLRERHRVLLVAFPIELEAGAHPADVRAGTERGTIAGEDDRAQSVWALRGQDAVNARRSASISDASKALWTSGRASVT